MKYISLLGATGSIGDSTLDVVRRHPDAYQVVAMACGRNIDKMRELIREHRPRLVSVERESDVARLREGLQETVEVLWGEAGAKAVATHDQANYVLSAMVGAAGLAPTLAAIQSGKTIGLANKETMVVAGEFMNAAAKEAGVEILPVDSEHSAIFQCLVGEKKSQVHRLILTASGGPFLETPQAEFAKITVEQALKHPNWDMGAKITIDSSTLMNKGLELVEARWLFDLPPEQLDVIVHPQSIIHSMVEYQDGSVMAQLGMPDMRVPIAYALSYPDRLKNDWPRLDLADVAKLTFFKPDEEKFRCLYLAKQAMKGAGTLPAVLNAANEIAVAKFLNREIAYLQIPQVVEETLAAHDSKTAHSLEEIMAADRWARDFAQRVSAAA